MKTLSFKNLNFMSVIATATLAAALTGCASKKDPTEGYDKGVLPHNSPAREQKEDVCGFSFSAPSFEVVEGGSFKQDILVNGKKFAGEVVLRGEPKGMTIKNSTVMYVVPRGIVPNGQSKAQFEYTVVPKSQLGENVQCSEKLYGNVSVINRPTVVIKNAPTAINLDSAQGKITFQVTSKSTGLKSNESLALEIGYDKALDSTERPILDLSQALILDKNSLSVNANERMFTVDIDTSKLAGIIIKKVGTQSTRTELIFLATLTVENEESKATYTKNLVINVTRSLPVPPAKPVPQVKPAPAPKATKAGTI